MFVEPQPLYYQNYDLDNVETPVKVEELIRMLKHYDYDENEISFLEEGFTMGFDIGYEGPSEQKSESENIPLKVGNKTDLWNKLMKEVELKRVAGLFDSIPFDNYIQSPIGLIPKAGNRGKTCLIFHLSHDFKKREPEKSLNHYTPKEKCTVKYRDLDFTVSAYLKLACRTNQSVWKTEDSHQ